MTTLSGQVLTPAGLRPGTLSFGGVITACEEDTSAPADRYLLPGFIDTHVHGGGGGDTMDGPEGVRRLALAHVRHGTTTLLPTTITAPWPEVLSALRGVREVKDSGGVPGGADMLGAHLEGPFISPERLGAQPPVACLPGAELVREVLSLGVVQAVTLAPELPGASEAALAVAGSGVRVGLGHTAGTYEQTWVLLDAVRQAGGRSAGTHLFNAMGGLSGRLPGPAGALLTHPEPFLELIADGHHLHPAMVTLALAAAPGRVILITDAMRAATLGDGVSELGGQRVEVRGGRATLEGGTLAGSVLTMDAALRQMLGYGHPLPLVSRLLSAHPAASLGLSDRGRLEVGLRADVVVLNSEMEVLEVYVAGERVC